jgi:D-alanine-D-alanine ligase-like ATP-grasp enzyme
MGATVLLEPQWGVVGQITFKNGRKSYFRHSNLDLNPLGASKVSSDKDFANFFMAKMGYPTIPGKAFYSDAHCKAIGSNQGIDAAYAYAEKSGFPVIVKPNSGSQGHDVRLVHGKSEFYPAMRAVFKHDRVGLVQRPVSGYEYRVVVLDDEIISAYQRIPLNVTGDGRSNIKQLLQKKMRDYSESGRDTEIDFDDPRIKNKLKRQTMDFKSVPARDERIYLLDNSNLSSGGDSVELTDAVHPAFKKIMIDLTRDMGLRLSGIDVMMEADISTKPGRYWILEVNDAPGFDHYAKAGKAQDKIVEDIYIKVLKAMER